MLEVCLSFKIFPNPYHFLSGKIFIPGKKPSRKKNLPEKKEHPGKIFFRACLFLSPRLGLPPHGVPAHLALFSYQYDVYDIP